MANEHSWEAHPPNALMIWERKLFITHVVMVSVMVLLVPFIILVAPREYYVRSMPPLITRTGSGGDSLPYIPFIVYGLLVPYISLISCFLTVIAKIQRLERVSFQFGLVLLAFLLGWHTYPILVNGIFWPMFAGGENAHGYWDPRGEMPFNWLGKPFHFAVLIVLPLAWVILTPILFLCSISIGVLKKEWRYTLAAIVVLLAAAGAFWIPPHYWFD
ncbi:MAG: hypothetical protein HY706_07980 [Candidatus Hydrogenedentes bacterium]|nr:hypothetical protein [Candidatus Hydrogenedentota bacterium]